MSIGTGVIWTGVVGTGVVGTGAVGTGVVGTGVVGTGAVGTGAVGTGGEKTPIAAATPRTRHPIPLGRNYIVMACVVTAYIVMDYIVLVCIVMAYIVMDYIVMVCIVMAYIVITGGYPSDSAPNPPRRSPSASSEMSARCPRLQHACMPCTIGHTRMCAHTCAHALEDDFELGGIALVDFGVGYQLCRCALRLDICIEMCV